MSLFITKLKNRKVSSRIGFFIILFAFFISSTFIIWRCNSYEIVVGSLKFFNDFTGFLSLLSLSIVSYIAFYILNKEIEEHYKFKALELVEEILNNFRIQPTINLIQISCIDKELSEIPQNSMRISNIVAICSMGAPISLSNLTGKSSGSLDEEILPDWKKGLIALWGIGLVSIEEPSIVKNWENGKIKYNPDIRKMNKDQLIQWINEYQKVMSGLEFAWSNNKKNILNFINDSVSYTQDNPQAMPFYPLDINYNSIRENLNRYFGLVYKNLAICEKLNFLLKRINEFSQI